MEILMTDRNETAQSPKPSAQATCPAGTYCTKDYIPPNPTVTLLFEGLLWFLFHGKDECQVAIHNTTRAATHRHRHELQVQVWKNITKCGPRQEECGAPEKISIDMKEFAGIQIDVNRPKEEGKNIYVYQSAYGKPKEDADWSYVTDFEKDPLYRNGIKLDAKDINPGVSINHGLFYTLLKTTYEFELRRLVAGIPTGASGSGTKVGNVALLVGGNIYLDDGGDVTLTVRQRYPAQPKIITLPKQRDKCYQIDIKNVCVKRNGERCERGHYGRLENDFYLYNDTFSVPSGGPLSTRRYSLHRLGPLLAWDRVPRPTPVQPICGREYYTDKYIYSNNEAPCGPVCAGAGGGG
ncbi:MAG TPA: hypothetical protein VFY61_18190 [Pyrinomonadaceae bacterium]|nr:hypothetical protein [Pyrinomonadaceae bacterium]